LAERGGEAQPVKNHVRETKRASRARPCLVRGESASGKRRELICVFDNAACHAAFVPCLLFEELRKAKREWAQGVPESSRKNLETARKWNLEPRRSNSVVGIGTEDCLDSIQSPVRFLKLA
jgi:hypothetical protein